MKDANDKTCPFSELQIKAAANWWADKCLTRFKITEQDERYKIFVESISTIIINAKILDPSPYTNIPYIQLGNIDGWSSNDCQIEPIRKALKDVKIDSFGISTNYLEMRIYTNGQIAYTQKFPGPAPDDFRVISTNPEFIHYKFKTINEKIDLSRAPYMKIRGPKFRVIEIKKEQVNGKLT
jgi:hypothetical protein